MKPRRIFLIAGEASGDIYGAQLVQELWSLDPTLKIAGLGGDRMAATGMELRYNLVREFAVMGFFKIAFAIPKVMRFLEIILDYFDEHSPDLVVLIDYPGFNLYLATHAQRRGIPVIYYVTPQIWAWAPGRIKKIKARIAKMLVIFPFEEQFYQQAHIPVEYVGHPLLDRLAAFQPDQNFGKELGLAPSDKFLAILPGSRRHEMQYNFPLQLKAARLLSQQTDLAQIVVALGHQKHLALCRKLMATVFPGTQAPRIVVGRTYDVLDRAHAALVTSGTASLETAMFETPLVVVYKIPALYHFVVRRFAFLQCEYIALPNIVAQRLVVPEFLISTECPNEITRTLLAIWQGPRRQEMLADLATLKERLAAPGASRKAAKAIIRFLHQESNR